MPITAKLVANLLVAAGVNRVLAIDLHAQQIQGFFDIPVDHLFCAPIFYNYIAEKKIQDLVVVTPDIGGMKMAAAYSQMLNSGLAIVSKKRLNASETQSTHLIGDVTDKNVLLVDDITETAGTICSAVEILRQHKAKDIYVGVPHAVLGDVGRERLKQCKIKELITTNTTPQEKIPGVTTQVLPLRRSWDRPSCESTKESRSPPFLRFDRALRRKQSLLTQHVSKHERSDNRRVRLNDKSGRFGSQLAPRNFLIWDRPRVRSITGRRITNLTEVTPKRDARFFQILMEHGHDTDRKIPRNASPYLKKANG